jgi:hypothetical protein
MALVTCKDVFCKLIDARTHTGVLLDNRHDSIYTDYSIDTRCC